MKNNSKELIILALWCGATVYWSGYDTPAGWIAVVNLVVLLTAVGFVSQDMWKNKRIHDEQIRKQADKIDALARTLKALETNLGGRMKALEDRPAGVVHSIDLGSKKH